MIWGLEYLHALKPPICHGDLKSVSLHRVVNGASTTCLRRITQVNILVNSSHDAIITDFGSAHRVSCNSAGDEEMERQGRAEPTSEEGPEAVLDATVCESTNTITLTKSSFTLRWAAPEVLKEEDRDIKADIWSFGWVCYEVW